MERGGLQFFHAFAAVWPGRISTLAFSRFSASPPAWLWGGPSDGMAIFDKSITTGLTLLKLRLFFADRAPIVLGSFSREHGRAGLPVVDLACEVGRDGGDVHVRPLPAGLGGEYLLACDTRACAQAAEASLGCPVLPLPSHGDLRALPSRAPRAGLVALDLDGDDFGRAGLVGRVLDRPIVTVTLDPARHADLCLDTGAAGLSLTPALAVRMSPEEVARRFGGPG